MSDTTTKPSLTIDLLCNEGVFAPAESLHSELWLFGDTDEKRNLVIIAAQASTISTYRYRGLGPISAASIDRGKRGRDNVIRITGLANGY